MLVNASEMLKKAVAGHYAVGQFNINNLEWTKSVLLTAEEMKTIRDFIDQYPTPEGECYELERTSPRYKGIILTDRNHVDK